MPQLVASRALRPKAYGTATAHHAASCRGLSQAVGNLLLQIPKRPSKLAIADIATTGEQGLQCRQERCPLGWLQRSGGVDDGDRLRFTEIMVGHS